MSSQSALYNVHHFIYRSVKGLLSQFGLLPTSSNLSNEVEKRIDLEILKIQQIRVVILICLGSLATTQAFVTEFFIPESSRPLKAVFQNFSLVEWGLLMLTATLYEVASFSAARKAIRRRIVPPLWIQYAGLIIEMSFPSLVIWYQGPNIHPIFATHTPFILTYSLFIMLTTLRLNFGFGVISGLAAGIGYFTVYMLITPQPRPITAENYFYASPMVALAVVVQNV